jgi:hypothetical protein
VPRALEKTTTFPLVAVDNGRPVVRHLTWNSREAEKKGREMVLVVRPVIYIEWEERERQKRAAGKE